MSDVLEHRVLVSAPFGKDAALIAAALEKEAVPCVSCRSLAHVALELGRGAAALLISEEVVAEGAGDLAALLARQPVWSDLPVLLLIRAGGQSEIDTAALRSLGNVTLLDRPVRVATLMSAVRSALRAREWQYRLRTQLTERDEADRRKDQFLAVLAHELRNPLAPIQNSLAVLRLSGPSPSSLPIHDIMERQVRHMVRLVDDLLDVSRITHGKIELRKRPERLSTLIDSAVETCRPVIDAAKHDLTIMLPTEELVVDADAMRLSQVLCNLLNNAAKYTEPGGRIAIASWRDGADAVISVSDTGIGISPASLSRVFDMFEQAHVRDTSPHAGLGIGLTLARSLVEMHGGTLTAESDGEGKGSVFIVRVPFYDGLDAVVAGSAQTVLRLQDRRIMIVDDNRDSADTLRELLAQSGADVRVAYDGRSALDAIAEFHPSVVFLDLGMPGMDGYEVARRIRAQPALQDIALVALTGWGQAADRRRTRKAGFDHHLIKPASPKAIEAVLASSR
jgi:signal transduction histidine kinase